MCRNYNEDTEEEEDSGEEDEEDSEEEESEEEYRDTGHSCESLTKSFENQYSVFIKEWGEKCTFYFNLY